MLESNSETFFSVVEANKGIIYKVVNSYCKDLEDRKDLTQEILIQLWKSFDNYNDQYKRSTWIYRIALNVSISFYRKENSRQKLIYPLTNYIIGVSAISDAPEKETNHILLEQFISELKDFDKAIALLYLEEKSYKEIAEVMGITETNVATKISRIKEKLKQNFSNI